MAGNLPFWYPFDPMQGRSGSIDYPDDARDSERFVKAHRMLETRLTCGVPGLVVPADCGPMVDSDIAQYLPMFGAFMCMVGNSFYPNERVVMKRIAPIYRHRFVLHEVGIVDSIEVAPLLQENKHWRSHDEHRRFFNIESLTTGDTGQLRPDVFMIQKPMSNDRRVI